jgi:ATP-dependent Lon protease
MTGEVSLSGLVLPVGGIKEKTIAARRSNCKVLVFPDANRRDVDELPAYLKEGIDIHFAKKYEDVYKVAFGEVQGPVARGESTSADGEGDAAATASSSA